jgi:DNA-binding beta-propeller fold protein YncE
MTARLLHAVVIVAMIAAGCTNHSSSQSSSALPLRPVSDIPLPGDNSRFDYTSLDSHRGLLFVAHLGAGEVIEVDVRTNRIVRTVPNISQVHGVLVVDSMARVYATATGTNEVVAIDENTGTEIGRAPTGDYPDGLAYDPRRNTVWTTNEAAGNETVVDATTLQPRGTVELGFEVGNVSYDSAIDRMLVAVQGANDLAVIDPTAMAVERRLKLPGCAHPHGLAVDSAERLAFVACDQNATLLTIDENDWRVTSTNRVGDDPDVLAYDGTTDWLYVAAESGTVTVLGVRDRALYPKGSGHLADGAHVVAIDPTTHRSFYPIPNGSDGRPVLLVRAAA